MVTFRVNDMTCGHCATSIARAVAAVADPHAQVEIDIRERLVRVTGHGREDELSNAIQDAGYHPEKLEVAQPVTRRAASGCCCGSRASAALDAGQIRATAADSCCS